MKVALPTVTLVIFDTRCHKLARLTADECLQAADFGEVIIFSDNFSDLRVPGATHHWVEDFPDKQSAQLFIWKTMVEFITTQHLLYVEWDAGIINPAKWQERFRRFDYIGAPWVGDGQMLVGNGGFSLRSVELQKYVATDARRFPPTTLHIQDALLCQTYRPALEGEGFHWAPLEIAREFAFELDYTLTDSFGFHGMCNWPRVFSGERLRDRLELARQNKYVQRAHGGYLQQLLRPING